MSLICINAVNVIFSPQPRRNQTECLKCEYTFWQQSPRLALDLAETSVPRQCQ
jgi:hypothetical protein